jgi:hypothetical protein
MYCFSVNDKGDFIFGAEDVKFRLNEVEKYQLISEDIFRSFPNYQNSTKYLIYHCSDKCGGFADRLKGIVFVYIMSVLTHRKFAINMTSPCELGRVLRPNLLDWRTPDMSKFTEKTYKIYDYFENNNAYSIDYERFDLDPIKMFDVDVAAVRANQDWTRIFRKLSVTSDRFPQLYQYHSSEILKIVYNGLFRPSTELQDQVDTFFANEVNGSKLACLHARIGEEKHQRYTENQMMTPILFLKQYDSRDNYKILVATDSDKIKMISKHLFRHFVDTDGPIMHIDYINSSSAENLNRNEAGFMRTMLDHMILQRCDKLILTASGFGVTAGSIRHTSHGLYVYMRDNAVMATTREILRETFQWRCIKRSWDSTEKDFFASICDS